MNKSAETKIVIVEDHENYREGLFHLFSATSGYNCVGKYISVEDALDDLPEADVMLLDIHLPGKSGIESIQLFKQKSPSMLIIMMTVFEDDENIFNSILAGADGYLLKKTSPAKVLAAIDDAMNGGSAMSPFVARRVLEHFKSAFTQQKEDYNLSGRENEILALLVQGVDTREIGEKLFISYETVRNHLKHIYEKMHVRSKSQAVTKAISERIVK